MKKKSFLAYPYVVWSAIFVIIPLILVVFFSFTKDSSTGYVFTLENYKEVIDPIYIKVFARSILLAGVATLICLVVGYPVAYIISKAHVSRRGSLILLFILPMWMNFLLRTYAWVAILGKNGLLNTFLGWFGIQPLAILYTNVAILLGMVYNFLPFMVLPIYTALSKMDNDLINAAHDLGANNMTVFRKIIFPLSLPGVMSGITMVFMPAVTTFAISRLLGGGKIMLVGDLIEQQFTVVGDWNFGSAISIFMMIVILISMSIMSKFGDESDKEGGGLLF
ncbi:MULTISPECIES: ABC transporter permease [unclassified Clostridioides]|uniref:ABC transporter permease n=1 Tax=unclassified Clostridioides TaxID=2635829 RepID=UPI001D116B23|nr:ABC transporter permease [Clostridioides sp. ZZV15-6388]MCC0646330.1 ABC transporter permease [Clostridioides sp. ZZV14-6150]MCC0662247.1 ABC transporter permease [Clostridioides sp. ZZV14-6154]MCC0665668.1 ABC transporter permease [Clostridioides sp. ZZV15-6597]MCC0670037.1 ABC transporter permease [Clostridioides sp. ZZV14-6153]MCC0720145.1 ABC transporter permease [Clostridioides sp. ZZV14-6105]MCC0724246.1 ABC transporter permease [Clostridioides sp. ZZV14-6104]MCC0728021.1 ABC transp